MATVADMRDLIFKGTVDEIDVGKLSVGMPTRIKVGALPTDVVTGRVSRIAPQAQQKEGATLFDVEVELDPSTKITLRAGYSANADVIIREKKDVLVIPERLVTFEDGGKKATVEVAGADRRKRPEESRDQDRHLRRPERRSAVGPEEGRAGRGKAAERNLVKQVSGVRCGLGPPDARRLTPDA